MNDIEKMQSLVNLLGNQAAEKVAHEAFATLTPEMKQQLVLDMIHRLPAESLMNEFRPIVEEVLRAKREEFKAAIAAQIDSIKSKLVSQALEKIVRGY